jgi:hypothetical protein
MASPPPAGAPAATGRPTPLRAVVLGLAAAWCLAGGVESALGAWRARGQPAALPGTVGAPLPQARDVAAIRAIQARLPHDGGRVLVLYPPQAPDLALAYVRFQLAHLSYRDPADVASVLHPPVGESYQVLIAAPGVQVPAGQAPAAQVDGFRAYRLVQP